MFTFNSSFVEIFAVFVFAFTGMPAKSLHYANISSDTVFVAAGIVLNALSVIAPSQAVLCRNAPHLSTTSHTNHISPQPTVVYSLPQCRRSLLARCMYVLGHRKDNVRPDTIDDQTNTVSLYRDAERSF